MSTEGIGITLCSEIARVKRAYYVNKFGGCTNSKSKWKLINRVLKSNSQSTRYKLVTKNGDTVTDGENVAREFNDFFFCC